MKTEHSSSVQGEPEPPNDSSSSAGNPADSARFLGQQLLELLLPSTCRMCDQCVPAGDDFCAECLSQLKSSEHLMQFACPRCGRPGAGTHWTTALAAPAARDSDAEGGKSQPKGCQSCRRQSYAFDGCIALWTYDSLVRNAVVAAKYGSQVALADALGRRLGARILQVWGDEMRVNASLSDTVNATEKNAANSERSDEWTPPDLITSVPSHLWRRVQRGAGGSRVLAKSVARFLRPDCPDLVHADLMTATRQIKKQAWLGEKDRASNVQGAFRVNRDALRSRLRSSHSHRLVGKHVLLIDDVMTTGATAAENARVLKLAGARRVTVAVVARACVR